METAQATSESWRATSARVQGGDQEEEEEEGGEGGDGEEAEAAAAAAFSAAAFAAAKGSSGGTSDPARARSTASRCDGDPTAA